MNASIGRRGFLTSLAGIAAGSGAIAATLKDREPPKLELKQPPAEEPREPWVTIAVAWRSADGVLHNCSSAFAVNPPETHLLSPREAPPYLVHVGGQLQTITVQAGKRTSHVEVSERMLEILDGSQLHFLLDESAGEARVCFQGYRVDANFFACQRLWIPLGDPFKYRWSVDYSYARHCSWNFPDHAINPFAAPAPPWRA